MIKWESPSNIALVKYWGKKQGGLQLPANPSLSLTLSRAKTITSIAWEKRTSSPEVSFTFSFEGTRNHPFSQRVGKYLQFLSGEELSFLSNLHLEIESENTFPAATGIASSASAMSALALCLATLESKIIGPSADFKRRASYLARLGSGSAARSIYPYASFWGEGEYFASQVLVHDTFKNYCNTILIVSSDPKKISSSDGHLFMNDHPYKEVRYQTVRKRAELALAYLETGDEESLGDLIEREALELHALMLTSPEPFCLLMPGTLGVINRVQEFRKDTGSNIYFSLDAGANVHLLYHRRLEKDVQKLIASLKRYLETCIYDRVGGGPLELSYD